MQNSCESWCVRWEYTEPGNSQACDLGSKLFPAHFQMRSLRFLRARCFSNCTSVIPRGEAGAIVVRLLSNDPSVCDCSFLRYIEDPCKHRWRSTEARWRVCPWLIVSLVNINTGASHRLSNSVTSFMKALTRNVRLNALGLFFYANPHCNNYYTIVDCIRCNEDQTVDSLNGRKAEISLANILNVFAWVARSLEKLEKFPNNEVDSCVRMLEQCSEHKKVSGYKY